MAFTIPFGLKCNPTVLRASLRNHAPMRVKVILKSLVFALLEWKITNCLPIHYSLQWRFSSSISFASYSASAAPLWIGTQAERVFEWLNNSFCITLLALYIHSSAETFVERAEKEMWRKIPLRAAPMLVHVYNSRWHLNFKPPAG